MPLAHGARLVTPSLEYLARSVVWDMPPHETSDFMMAVPFLDVDLVERVSRGEGLAFANACNIVMMWLASGDSILDLCILTQIKGSLVLGSGNLFSWRPSATSSSFVLYNLDCHCWELLSN